MLQKRFLKHDNRQINITVDPLMVNAENCFPKIKRNLHWPTENLNISGKNKTCFPEVSVFD